MERADTKRGSPSKKQVEVWLTTVLNPLARALAAERACAASKHWSFREHSEDFEFLQPTRTMVSDVYVKNLEQVQDYLPSLAAKTTRHDQILDQLRAACRDAFRAILDSEEFQLETRDQPDARRYMAQYLVNSVGELPSHYALREYWARHREELVRICARPPIAKCLLKAEKTGELFTNALDALRQEVDRQIADLADRHKLPRVPPID